jgi:predicted house-cleaning NTP pyrophosphatase (Maf/HAM1 superfamily)
LAAKPDDDFAGKAAMDVAKGKADSVYKFTQNEQVVVNAATTVAFVAAG